VTGHEVMALDRKRADLD